MSHVRFHEAECIDSQSNHLFGFDDFWGDSLDAKWRLDTTGTGACIVVDGVDGGICRLRSPAASDQAGINWTAIRSLHFNKKLVFEARVRAVNGTVTNTQRQLCRVRYDANNLIRIYHDYSSVDIIISCANGGVSTNFDSGVNVDENWHIYRIECHTHGANHVHFYIDGVECGNSPITTNIPSDAADYLEPYFNNIANASLAAETQTDIDYIAWRQNI